MHECSTQVENLRENGTVVHEHQWWNQNEDHRELNDDLEVAVYRVGNDHYWYARCNDGESVAKLNGPPTQFVTPKDNDYPNPSNENDDNHLCKQVFGVDFDVATYVHSAF